MIPCKKTLRLGYVLFLVVVVVVGGVESRPIDVGGSPGGVCKKVLL